MAALRSATWRRASTAKVSQFQSLWLKQVLAFLGKGRANFYGKANTTRLNKVKVEWIKFVILFAELNMHIDIEKGGSSPVEKWHMMSLEMKHIWSFSNRNAWIYLQSERGVELIWPDSHKDAIHYFSWLEKSKSISFPKLIPEPVLY